MSERIANNFSNIKHLWLWEKFRSIKTREDLSDEIKNEVVRILKTDDIPAVPIKYYSKIFFPFFQDLKEDDIILVDWPNMRDQFGYFVDQAKWKTHIIYLDVEELIGKKRAKKRMQTGSRIDDTDTSIEERSNLYKLNLKPYLDMLYQGNPEYIHRIDANKDEEEVYIQIKQVIDEIIW